ncbi:hypothetical protein Bbelb_305880 [Branchiostoma belcheri]|nr:hypothetical protein Bbelb_305880 [Branchiostoma belcheri]
MHAIQKVRLALELGDSQDNAVKAACREQKTGSGKWVKFWTRRAARKKRFRMGREDAEMGTSKSQRKETASRERSRKNGGREKETLSTYEKKCGEVKHTALPADQPPAVVPCTTVCSPRATEMEMGTTLRSA